MKRILTSLILVLSLLTAGCGPVDPDPNPNPTPTPPPGPVVNPTVPVAQVTMSHASVEIEIGGSVTLTATVSPSNATDKTVTWSSSDAGVATVSSGVVTAVSVGSATITASAGGKSATCSVKVNPIAVTGVSISQTSVDLKVGSSVTLKATVSPDNATDKTVKWTVSDPTVASVDNSGKVTGLAPGKAKVTVAAHNGISASADINVFVSGGNEDFGYIDLKQ